MTTKKLGSQTAALANPPSFAGHANVVGKKEGEGPLADSFDYIAPDDTFGESTVLFAATMTPPICPMTMESIFSPKASMASLMITGAPRLTKLWIYSLTGRSRLLNR